MATRTKKTVTEAENNVVKNVTEEIPPVDWNGAQISIKRNLSIREVGVYVDGVAGACISNDGEYRPEFKDFLIRAVGLELYTNVSMPESIDDKYKFVYETDIWSVTTAHINTEQFYGILEAIDAKIDYMLSTKVSMMNKKFAELCDAVDRIQEQIISIFGDIDAGDVKALVGAMSNGVIDEDKLVKAYIDNIKSDTQK